jgi:hypothetical protein
MKKYGIFVHPGKELTTPRFSARRLDTFSDRTLATEFAFAKSTESLAICSSRLSPSMFSIIVARTGLKGLILAEHLLEPDLLRVLICVSIANFTSGAFWLLEFRSSSFVISISGNNIHDQSQIHIRETHVVRKSIVGIEKYEYRVKLLKILSEL